MKETLRYREPDTAEGHKPLPSPRRMAKVGFWICLISLGAIALPIFVPTLGYGKYMVVVGAAGFLAGLNFLVNALIDWIRGCR